MVRLLVLPPLLAACGSDYYSGDDEPDAGPDADSDTDSDSDVDTDVDTDIPECVDDRLEDNNHDAEAVEVEDGEVVEDLVVCDDDDDWFAIPLQVGQFLEATVRYVHAPNGDLAVQVIGTDGETVLYSVNSEDDDEVVRWWPWEDAGDGTYYVRVYGRPLPGPDSELDRTTYSIEFGVDDEIPCFPDDHEEDDDAGSAGPVPPEETGDDYTICPGDADWFAVDATAGQAIVAFAKYYSPHGHLDLEVLDATGTATLATAFDYDPLDPTSVFGREHAVLAVETDGTYLLRVAGGADVTNEYAFVAYVRRDPCSDDAFEENDYVPWATPLVPGRHEAAVCFYDIDWYAIEVEAGQTVTADVLFDQEFDSMDLDAWLFAPDTVSELDASTSNDSDESLEAEAALSGTHYLVVQGFGGAENAYTLVLGIE